MQMTCDAKAALVPSACPGQAATQCTVLVPPPLIPRPPCHPLPPPPAQAKLPSNALYHRIALLFGKAKRAMMRGDYEPATDPRAMAVMDALPWLQRPPTMRGYPTPEHVFTV